MSNSETIIRVRPSDHATRKQVDTPLRDESRDAIVLQYLPLVRHVVRRLACAGNAAGFSHEDLVSYGTIGLIQAIDRFDSDRSPRFVSYAAQRIRGSVIDAIRVADPLSRTTRQRVKGIDRIADGLTARLGRLPSADEIQQEAGLTGSQYWDALSSRNVHLVPLDTSSDEDDRGSPVVHLAVDEGSDLGEGIERRELLAALAEAVQALPEREKRVIMMSFSEARSLTAIGDDLGISASRVSQLRSRAIERLRSSLLAAEAA